MKLSILLAARNEAANILPCLHSLAALDTAQHEVEILIGDDQSTDATAEVVGRFIQDYPHFRLIPIQPSDTLSGKANALCQLCQYAHGEWWLFTDADMVLPPTWLQAIVAHIDEQTGVIVGCTVPQALSLWSTLQTLDWAMYLGILYVLAQCGVAVTGMGNNMAVAAQAYRQVGGYENLPFSLTEDYILFRAIVAQGFGFKQLYSQDVLGQTQAVGSWQGLLAQRRRWLAEFRHFPSAIQLGILWQGLFLCAVLLLAFFSLTGALCLGGARLLCSVFVLAVYLPKVRLQRLLIFVPLYEAFSLLFYTHLVFSLFFTSTHTWKGRNFSA